MARNNNAEQATKPLAKSLHTISVLVNLGAYLVERGDAQQARSAVSRALAILGHEGKEDPYGLAAIATEQLGARMKAAKKGE